MAKKTIVDKKREKDIPYKESDVQHYVNDKYHGVERIDLDSRKVAGSDALFGSYDYFGSNHEATETNPSVGPYWRMQNLKSLDSFLEDVRQQRINKIEDMNNKHTGHNQKVHYMKQIKSMLDMYEGKINKIK